MMVRNNMLKRKRLYKDTKGQVWHVKSDGKAVRYPQFAVYTEIPKGAYEEISYKEHGVDVSDKLYLANQRFSYHLCIVAQYEEDFGNADYVFDVLSGEWVYLYGIDWILWDVVGLEKGTKYVVEKKEMTFVRYRKEDGAFVFRDDTSTELFLPYLDLRVYQITDIKEVSHMSKEYKVWKTENGELYGRDCETGRTFVISEETFERVEYCAKQPRVGDIVYINNFTGVKPYEITFVQDFAKRLNDDLLMLRYAYGYYPNFDTRDQSKRLWKVLYVGITNSIIEEHSMGNRPMICVCDNDSLTVSENQEDDEPF